MIWCKSEGIPDLRGGLVDDIRKSTIKALSPYVKEHFPDAAYGAYPIENDSKVAVIIVGNKYSPKNFWYGYYGIQFLTGVR